MRRLRRRLIVWLGRARGRTKIAVDFAPGHPEPLSPERAEWLRQLREEAERVGEEERRQGA